MIDSTVKLNDIHVKISLHINNARFKIKRSAVCLFLSSDIVVINNHRRGKGRNYTRSNHYIRVPTKKSTGYL